MPVTNPYIMDNIADVYFKLDSNHLTVRYGSVNALSKQGNAKSNQTQLRPPDYLYTQRQIHICGTQPSRVPDV